MSKFLNILGAIMMICGALVLAGAQSAIHEIEAALGLGFGAIVLSLGIIAGTLQKILDELRQRPASTSSTPSQDHS